MISTAWVSNEMQTHVVRMTEELIRINLCILTIQHTHKRKNQTYESDSSELDSVVLDCSAFHLLYLSTSSVR